MSKFINAEVIFFTKIANLTEIPPRAFGSSQVNKLKVLNFMYSFTKINSYAFSSLDNLREIKFFKNKFEAIAENAFSFDHASNKSLSLEFFSRDTNDFGFNEKSLVNINRPTKLTLDIPELPESGCYLEERIYLPFLLDNPKNTIEVCFNSDANGGRPGGDFNCSDVRNLWFKNNNDLVQRITYCNDGSDQVHC